MAITFRQNQMLLSRKITRNCHGPYSTAEVTHKIMVCLAPQVSTAGRESIPIEYDTKKIQNLLIKIAIYKMKEIWLRPQSLTLESEHSKCLSRQDKTSLVRETHRFLHRSP